VKADNVPQSVGFAVRQTFQNDTEFFSQVLCVLLEGVHQHQGLRLIPAQEVVEMKQQTVYLIQTRIFWACSMPNLTVSIPNRPLEAKPGKIIVDIHAAIPSSWKIPRMLARMVW
jgi:hypothetical protein